MVLFIMIEFILWIIVDICLFCYFILFLNKGINETSKSIKNFFFSVSFFFLLIGIQRLFSIIYDFFYQEDYFLLIIISFMISSSIPLLYHLENSIIKSRRIFSIVTLILLIIFIISLIIFNYDRILMYYLSMPPFIIAMGAIGSIYIYLFIKSSGEVRKNAFLIIMGISLMLIFWFLHNQFGRRTLYPDPILMDVIGIISPIGYMMGLLLLVIGFHKRK